MTVRPTFRLKLTMAYGGLFLLAGAILLTLNYALVRSSLGKPAPQVGVTFTAPAPGAAGLSGKETQVFVGSAGYRTGKALRVWVELGTAFAGSLPPKRARATSARRGRLEPKNDAEHFKLSRPQLALAAHSPVE